MLDRDQLAGASNVLLFGWKIAATSEAGNHLAVDFGVLGKVSVGFA